MKTTAIVNLKGGVAKTATSTNLAYELATRHGQRVLLIDCDQNMGATMQLLPPERGRNTVAALLTGICDYPYDLIYKTEYEGVDIIPADESLAAYGTDAFASGKCNISALRDLCTALAEDDAYDHIIIDSAPGMAAPMVCTVYAADDIIIPMTLDFYGLGGMRHLMTQIESVREVRPEVRIAGCLVTMFRADGETDADLAALRAESPVHVFTKPIRWSPVVRTRTKGRSVILKASPTCAASWDYKAFVAELMEMEGK